MKQTRTHSLQPSRFSGLWTNRLLLAILLTAAHGWATGQFTYDFQAVSGTYTPIAGGTDLNSLEVNDAQTGPINLGFTFVYNGANVTQVDVNSNGWISMDVTDPTPSTADMTTNSIGAPDADVRPAIAPLWDNLSGTGGIAKHQTTGSAPNRVFTMDWRNWRWGSGAGGAVISFQVKLYETSNIIEFIYQQEATAVSSGSASIGLMASASGTYYSLNNTGTSPTASTSTATNNLSTKPANGQVYRFTPCSAPTATITGLSTNCASGTFTFNVNVTGLGSGANVDIVATPGGVIHNDVGTGTFACGPFTNGTPVSIVVNNNSSANTACDLSLGSVVNNLTCIPNGTCGQNLAIVDDGCGGSETEAGINVSPGGTTLGTDVFLRSVELIATHNNNADLDIYLIAPNGSQVELITDRFGSGNDLGNNGSCTPIVLVAGGTALTNTNTNAPTGNYAPEAALTGATGNPNGTWTLQVCDDNGNGTAGVLRYAKLNFEVCSVPTATIGTQTTDCGANTFTVPVNITGLGSAPNVDIVASPGGVIHDNVGTGTFNCTFTVGSTVTLTVVNNSNSFCNLALGSFSSTLTCATNGACGLAVAIPDNGCGTNTFAQVGIGMSGLPTTLGSSAQQAFFESVDVKITHTWRGDLRLYLVSPAGTVRTLFLNRQQDGSSNDNGDNLGNNTLVCPAGVFKFKDGATALAGGWTTDAVANIAGTFAPEQTLAGFNGENPNGTWILRVCDAANADLGTITHVKLNFQVVDCQNVAGGAALPGTACNDGNACTINDIYQSNCSCAGTFEDTDGDGTCNANDGCPNDPNKIAPGICGCGTADTDTDSDGTADCNDGCPNDPLKTAPGQCGCGAADTDTDSDGTADCNDGCPNDPNKIAPGICGCGTADTDTDSDGTADCNDGCPNDPNKIAPGICGCGVSDADTDSDGTADCNDGCPNDPNKIAPGICGCGTADTDTDSDGTADCNDGCPNDPNKIAPGICGCGTADTDTDSDGTADCNDGCPNDPNKIAPGICGCGVSDADTDSDGTADCNDGCPNDPNKIAPGDCGCGNVETGDTDEDGVADCLDGCPFDDTKTAPGNCGCGNPEPGAACDDGDNTTGEDTVQPDCSCAGVPVDCNYVPSGPDMPGSPCDDGNPDTGNDTWGNDCLCVGELLDCEGTPGGTALPGSVCDDGLATTGNDMYGADCVCAGEPIDCEGTPNGTALPGTPCDDGDPNTINDQWDGSCACVGTPSCTGNMVTLTLNTDANGNETSWEIVQMGGGAALCQGSGFANNSSIDSDCCLADGCYRLLVFDSFGDGMTTGGYVLRDANGEMIIDNAGNGGFTAVSAIANNGGFCLPIGVDHLIAADCGRMDLLPSSTIKSTVNGAVSAQYGVGDQTDDGYQFWLFDPNGSYSRVIFKSHANHTPGTPQGPGACSNLVLSSLQTMPPPANKMLNVRVRTRVNGVSGEYGPACRIMIDLVGTCPTTSLVNAPNDPKHSCGASKTVGASTKLYANAVAGANKFQWRFENTGNGYVRTIATTGEVVTIGNWATNPLLCGTHVYQVSLRASFDGGATYCPYGAVCNVTITNNNSNCTQNFQGGGANLHLVQQEESGMSVWPNPLRDGRLTVELHGLNEAEAVTTIELYDMFGKRVHTQSLATDGATELTTVLELPQLSTGLYILNATSGERLFTTRVAVQ